MRKKKKCLNAADEGVLFLRVVVVVVVVVVVRRRNVDRPALIMKGRVVR